MKIIKHSGFSLLELSIVLVIIGLIAGGIVAGSSMIRAAELRSVITERTQLKTAMNTFKDKYLGIPGDLKNATAFWGFAAGTTGLDDACWDTASTGVETCNGNGDGHIGFAADERYEVFRAFQHLANAELINGTYTGVGVSITGSGEHAWCESGVNCMASKLGNASWQMRTNERIGNVNNYDYSKSLLVFFGDDEGGNANPHGAVLTTQEMWNIDKKVDDGSPAYGSVRSHKKGATATWAATVADCATNADPALAEYDLQREGLSCSMSLIF